MNLELAILHVLDAATGARPLPDAAIHAKVPLFAAEDFPLADVQRALNRLATKGHAKGTRDEDLGNLWIITPGGRLRIS